MRLTWYRASLFLRRHVILVIVMLVVAGLGAYALEQRSQIKRVDRNTERLDRVNQALHRDAREDRLRLFESCVRVAALRRRVNTMVGAIRLFLVQRVPVETDAGRRAAYQELLRSLEVDPGATTRDQCLRIAPPPPPR